MNINPPRIIAYVMAAAKKYSECHLLRDKNGKLMVRYNPETANAMIVRGAELIGVYAYPCKSKDIAEDIAAD